MLGKSLNSKLSYFFTQQIVMEALFRLQLECFAQWYEKHPDCQVDEAFLLSSFQRVRYSYNKASVDELIANLQFLALLTAFELYKREEDSPLKAFWNTYLDMISLLLCFLRATREGNWQLHLACIRDMLPWMYAYDRLNYAKYMAVY